jgi:hypothetical protein
MFSLKSDFVTIDAGGIAREAELTNNAYPGG